MESKARGTAEMVAAMTILETIGWFVVESGGSALSLVFWRCAFGSATLLAICAVLSGKFRVLSWRTVVIAAAGGVAIVVNWILLFGAFTRASISIATAVYNMQPFILVLMGAVFLSERLTLSKVVWLVVGFGGLVLVVQAKPGAGSIDAQYLMGIGVALGAAFFWAVAAILAKKLAGTPPYIIALIHVLVGTVMLAPFQSNE